MQRNIVYYKNPAVAAAEGRRMNDHEPFLNHILP